MRVSVKGEGEGSVSFASACLSAGSAGAPPWYFSRSQLMNKSVCL